MLTKPPPACLSLPPSNLLASHPQISSLAVSTLAFRTGPRHQQHAVQALLLCRDSKQGWEPPVTTDVSDERYENETLSAAATRLLCEETGLTVRGVLFPVGMLEAENENEEDTSPSGGARNEGSDDDENNGRIVSFPMGDGSNSRAGRVTLAVEVCSDVAAEDHDGDAGTGRRAWMTEEEVRTRRWTHSGGEIRFASEAARRIVLEGFRARAARERTRLRMLFHCEAFRGGAAA